ncbi:MAG: hypothetical protein H8E27_01600, partial [Verrucomicrobia subdivision 3 bacterium]|nr:hypothetical protein [Limisphaerales bacterium]
LTDKEMATLEAAARRQAEADSTDALSAEKLCQITNLSDQRHRQLAKAGYFPPPIKGIYQLTPALQGVIRYMRDQSAKAGNSLEQEKLKKLTAERQIAELELAKRKGEALDARAVVTAWENIVVTIRQKLMAMPAQLGPRLAYLKEQHKIEEELEREVNDYLQELSKPQNYDHGEPENDDEETEAEIDGPAMPKKGNKKRGGAAKAAAKN